MDCKLRDERLLAQELKNDLRTEVKDRQGEGCRIADQNLEHMWIVDEVIEKAQRQDWLCLLNKLRD